MPVKPVRQNGVKNNGTKTVVSEKNEITKKECWCSNVKAIKNHYACEFCKKLFVTLLFVLLVYVIFWFGTLIRNNIKEYNSIGYADKMERTITVQAEGEVTAVPDIAMTTMGMSAQGATVEETQIENTVVMNKLIVELKALGIEEEDIQTSNYNVYPYYNYTNDEGRILEGYEVSQSVGIKIRNLDNADQVIALAGKVGANSVSGLQFTIDDPDVYKEQARVEALQKVYQKASALSRSLGVKLVSIVSYNEYESGGDYQYKYADAMYLGEMGGIGSGVPSIEPGSTDVKLNVSITFEIR